MASTPRATTRSPGPGTTKRAAPSPQGSTSHVSASVAARASRARSFTSSRIPEASMVHMASTGRTSRLSVFALALVALAAVAPARAAVSVGLTPASQTVTPGTDFDLFIDITSAGSAFNGFDAVVTFNPAALTFLPLAPTTLQQGCLMTGSCSSACGSTFHLFGGAADSLSVSDVLLCNQIFLTGPGHLYKLRFHASSTPQVTHVSFRSSTFYNAGLFVTPVSSSDATIGIGITLGVGAPGSATPGRVRAAPNPSFGRVEFVAQGDAAVTAIEILDLQGRVVRALTPADAAAGTRLTWDGRDARGERLPAGVYQARIHR